MNIQWFNEKRKVKDLIPWDKNPRKISEDQLEQLKKSLDKFNYATPICISKEGTIVAGHMRTRALIALGRGEEEIDVRVASRELTKEEFEEFAIRDNANGGEWDFKALLDFSIDTLADWGFDSDGVDRLRKRVREDEYDADEKVKQIETPKTETGTLYILGRHRLLCADARHSVSYERLMDSRKARLIFTDPPYSVSYESESLGAGGGTIKNDDLTPEKAREFYAEILEKLDQNSTADAAIYWWFANKMNWINRLAWMDSGWEMAQIIIWLKETMIFSMGQDYHRCYEPCMFGWKKGHSHFRNKKITTYRDCFMLDETDFKELPDVWYQNRDKTKEYVHPTQKPVRLAERAIKKNSVPGDIVLDVFGGSGSTLMACEQMDRVCFLMELDPKFCDAIVDRWERFTGQKAQVFGG